MCDTNVYMIKEGSKEELFLSDVSFVKPKESGKLSLVNLFGEEKVVRGFHLRDRSDQAQDRPDG